MHLPSRPSISYFVESIGFDEARIRSFVNELERWNRKIRLMSRGESAEPHVVDSLVLAAYLPEGVSLVDVGTGGGFPGMVVALARPDVRVTLVEPIAKKTSFLTYVSHTLGIDVEIVTARIQDVPDRQWDHAVCKAFTDIHEWTDLASPIAHALWYYPTRHNLDDMPEGWGVVAQWKDSRGRERYLASSVRRT